MITRRCLLWAPMALPALAHAAALQVDYDIVPTAIRTPDSINYYAADWSNISNANVFGTCFTCHTRTFRGGPYHTVQEGIIRVCLGGSGQVRLVSFYYDPTTGLPVYDRSWAPPFQCRPQYNVDNQGAEIFQHFNATIANSPLQQIFTLEVIGTGNLYMARLELKYDA